METITWPSISGIAYLTPGTPRIRAATSSKPEKLPSRLCTTTWPFKPSILLNSSWRKPFITAMTMISVATPSVMPMKEKPAITEMNPSLRRARK